MGESRVERNERKEKRIERKERRGEIFVHGKKGKIVEIRETKLKGRRKIR